MLFIRSQSCYGGFKKWISVDATVLISTVAHPTDGCVHPTGCRRLRAELKLRFGPRQNLVNDKGVTPVAFELPPLPYDSAALEPTIDEATMKLHHDKNHQAYVTNLTGGGE